MNFFPPRSFLFQAPRSLIIGERFPTHTNFLKQYTCDYFFAISQNERPVKGANTLYSVLQVDIKKPTFCQLLTSFHRSLLIFLLNVLRDLNDELYELCRSIVTHNTWASLYFILTYQIKFPPPHFPGYQIWKNFPFPTLFIKFWSIFQHPLRLFQPLPFYQALKSRLICKLWICKVLQWCSHFLF